jgi:hypothetical protein
MATKRKQLMMVGLGALLGATASVASAATAQTFSATGSGGAWDHVDPTTGTWTVSGSPAVRVPGNDPVNFTDTVIVSGGRTVTLSNGNGASPWAISGYQGRAGTLNISSGANLTWSSVSNGFQVQFNSATAQTSTVGMTGGTITSATAGANLILSNTASANPTSTGNFNQSGGVVDLSTNASSLLLTVSTSGAGTYTLSGSGLLKIGGDLDPGAGTGSFAFTGGTLVHNGLKMNLVNAGGTLAPGGVGTVGTSLLHAVTGGTTGFNYTQNSGTLAIDIASTDPNSGYDKILGTGVTDESSSSNVVLNGTIQINLIGPFTPANGDTFDIITTANISNSSIDISNATITAPNLLSGSFSAAVVPGTGNSDILRLTYNAAAAPEPASLALLSIGALALLRRRKS